MGASLYHCDSGMAGLLNEQYGGINNLLHALGITANIPWMTDALWARIGIIIVNVWLGFPYMMNVCLGGLQAIPNDYYEAAKIDGASRFQCFRTITLPLVTKLSIRWSSQRLLPILTTLETST